uniref:Sororin C-terminal region domain-containing protein n=1 Tax=Nelumbo nucifera TaxID=4432 RepID=A0A822Y343_NELNU|nr:TPA_asm: hypothetical protein HUJ06_027871 [Nelumbo nucifera]
MSRMVNGREVMEDERRVKKRKPLSDCTNTVSSRISSHSHAKPRKHSRSTKAADNNSLKYDTSTGSNAAENPGISISPSTPPPQQTRSVSSAIHGNNSAILKVYSRTRSEEKRKNEGKAVAVGKASSCPPVRRITRIGDKTNEEHKKFGFSKTCRVPRSKRKKECFPVPGKGSNKYALPQNFIDQQRAYFAEVDAFELPEEVATSESE